MENICRADIFAEKLNVSADILALAEVRLAGAEEVSYIFYGNKKFLDGNPGFRSRLLSLLSPIA